MPDQKPLVTIVTVTYNSAAYVRDAIESVLAQSYQNIEYIIGDDNSSDITWNIIREYDDPRIKAYRNQTNLKEYPNRNKALKLATGKYLIFIDGDDLIYPHAIDFLVNMMETFPDVGMALMQSYRPNIFYPVEASPRRLFLAEFFDKSLLDSAFTNTFFKTQILHDMGGLVNDYASGDTVVRLEVAKKYNCLLVNDNLTWWRLTPGQASASKAKSLDEALGFYGYRKGLLNEFGFFTDEEKTLASRNLDIKLMNNAIVTVLKGEVVNGLTLLLKSNLLFKALFFPFYKLTRIDPFEGYSSINLFRTEIIKNPYANPPKKNLQ